MLVKLGNKYLLLKNIISCFFALPQGEQDKATAYKYTLTVIKKSDSCQFNGVMLKLTKST